MNDSEDQKLVLHFIENIGYSQRDRERMWYECIFFLVLLREILLELNFKRLKVVYYRRLQILSKFFSLFNNT